MLRPLLVGLDLNLLGAIQGSDLVGLGALVVNDATPVETEAELIGVSASVDVAVHATRHVLLDGFDSVHVLGHGMRQQSRGLDRSGEYVVQANLRERTVTVCKAHQDCVAGRLDLSEAHRSVGNHDEDELGISRDVEPIMTLTFMSLPVIPEVKLTDMGLFDVEAFRFLPLEAE